MGADHGQTKDIATNNQEEKYDTSIIQLYFQESNKMFEHEKQLLSCSMLGDYLCTVGNDRLVKIFSTKGEKTLIREIAMSDHVSSTLILNDKLNYIYAPNYKAIDLLMEGTIQQMQTFTIW